ncbi:family 78 glycoside hydrolase catalytic domain [Amycolatopsis sp. A133]|uniref:family 78 glycoside hydrolase catalytic domain n=1 Tax=Amycolatopsis sp. A133 TaxID=3064472 RepID=UPI0027EC81D4|nr:family 78 glycoside hydrolase catalytic domain [Amycolatopsis sp. A133]MDQ7806419.1 family 78 glycoside hydrolase catalytic domain [Amycolatopsis sp. A133]
MLPSKLWRATTTTIAAILALSATAVPPAGAAPPPELSGAHWIWYPEGDARVAAPAGTRYFRTTFTAPAGAVTGARLVLTGDDTADVWLNGTPLASSARTADAWRTALPVDLQPALVPGVNTLAVAVRNAGGPAGLLGRLRVTTAAGTTDLATGAGWKSATTAPEGWEQPGFADAAWSAAADLGAFGTGPWGTGVTAPDSAAASPLSVASATVANRVDPLGVDPAQPRFGWKLTSSSPQQRQSAYQIVVSANGSDVWDSGRVSSAQQSDVAYGGPALASLTAYSWRVRVWDGQGRTAGWSPVHRFETALRAPAAEWTGAFLGRATAGPDLAGASWIWYPEGDPLGGVPPSTRFFRKTVGLATAPASATLVVTGDDTATVWVNGTRVSDSPRAADSWKTAAVAEVGSLLTAGANTLAISTENTTQSPAGTIAKLTVQGGPTVVTDGTWKAGQSGPDGWQQRAFDDSSWPAARALTAYGTGPWGANVSVSAPAPLLRKSFTVTKPVASARLLTTALGLQETHLNGVKVGSEVLAPGWTDYAKRLQYRVSDVTGQIRAGENVLGALVGNGWYSGSVGIAGSRKYGTEPWYSAQLRLTFTDGTSSTVATDGTWKAGAGPIRADDLYQGETYDARLATGWDRPGFDDRGWAAPRVRGDAKPNLVSQVDNGVTVQQEFKPVSWTQPKPGVWVADLGQNFSGWNRLSVTGPAGTTVTLRHSEVLNPDGTIYPVNLRAAQATDRFTLAGTGGAETYEPRFTVHGYRYVELTGLPSAPTPATLTGRAMWTSGAQTGTFTTSDALVNQLQHNILWGERSNMLSIPSDCPQRDERLGWTGDIGIFAGTSTFNLDVANFLGKFSDDLVDAQHDDGSFTDVAPGVLGGSGTAGWGDAGVIVPYTLWQRYGDTGVVQEHFAAMVRWVEYLRSTSGADLIRDHQTYGDWLNVDDNTAQDLISTAFFAWSSRLVSRMAAATGHGAEAAKYGTLADQVAAAFTRRFVAADGTIGSNSQTGYVLALAFGLLPASLVQPAADKLAARVAAAGGHLSVGFLGVENLLPVLAAHGHADVAYRVLLQPGFPGWGYMIGRGATTIWERWDGIKPDGSFNDPGMNSFNHYGLGSVGDFLYRSVGGLAPASPGYAALLVAPRPGGGLTSAKSAYETPYGGAVSDWATAAGTLTLRVTIPAGTSATVVVPTSRPSGITAPPEAVPSAPGTYFLPAGSYVFTAPA